MNRNVFIKSSLEGNIHEAVETSFIIMLSKIYSNLTFYGTASHCSYLKDILHQSSYDCTKIEFRTSISKLKGSKYLIRTLFASFSDILFYLKQPENTDIFYVSSLSLALLPIHFLSLFFKKRIYCVCHTELELIAKKKFASKTEWLLGINYTLFFRIIKISSYIKFIVLGESIRKFLCQDISKKNIDLVVSIDHPYFRPDFLPCATNKLNCSSAFKLGLISSGNPGPLSNFLLHINENKNITVYSISKFNDASEKFNKLIRLNNSNKLLDYSLYATLISLMDAIVFFYPLDSYKYTASGALLEAIWLKKPIIALRNWYFSYMFEKFGTMGVLCDSIEELVGVVNQYENFLSMKDRYVFNMNRAKSNLHPLNIVKYLEELLK